MGRTIKHKDRKAFWRRVTLGTSRKARERAAVARATAQGVECGQDASAISDHRKPLAEHQPDDRRQ